MLIDGEKYACEACVRGHRVSNCQHSNRPLQHINKKGRPVSQCAHCRSLRKSRAAHVKCDCGEKTSKCAHLQPTLEGHRETCCCNHGGRCTCAFKKENPLDPVPESDSDDARTYASSISMAKMPPRRRRAATVHSSDPRGLTFDQHGHHKPSKHNRASQKCEPYTLSRVNSVNPVTGLSLVTEALLFPTREDDLVFESREQRQVKSETASPLMSSSGYAPLGNSHVPPLDLSDLDYPSSQYEMFNTQSISSDHEAPLFSASVSSASVDWNAYDLRESNGESFTPSSYSQAGTQSFSALDFGSGSEQLPHLANTTSNSGDVSEVEDFLSNGDGELDTFGMGGNAFLRQGNAANSMVDLGSIDYSSFYKNEDGQFSVVANSMVEEDPAFWMPNYNDGIATVDSPDEVGPNAIGTYWEN